ncbi:MAG: hypothetical protein QOE11_2493 [Solirubrobacteraceae bacterium]|jgi:hypothetical protein|nr:hypothetical protein [Solirubrobacteraceae bacterium]
MSHALLTAALVWIGLSYVLGVVVALDQWRRPAQAWEAADRNRRFWFWLTIIAGFHGMGEYAAAAYLVGVVPRFRATGPPAPPRRPLQRAIAAVVGRVRRVSHDMPADGTHSSAEELALVAALLVFVSSFIHSAQIAPHWEQYWLYGAFFAVTTVLQAIWAMVIHRDPLNRRALVAGAIGNAALIVIWAITRTAGVPIGPQARPEAVGVIDVLSKLDELAAVVLIGVVLGRLRDVRRPISPGALRLAAMLAGPLFIYSVLAAFGGGHHHH